MIFSRTTREYFQVLQAKVTQAMVQSGRSHPYFLKDPFISSYEMLREVWLNGESIHKVCREYGLSRTQYYENEKNFLCYGVAGLFPIIKKVDVSEDLRSLF